MGPRDAFRRRCVTRAPEGWVASRRRLKDVSGHKPGASFKHKRWRNIPLRHQHAHLRGLHRKVARRDLQIGDLQAKLLEYAEVVSEIHEELGALRTTMGYTEAELQVRAVLDSVCARRLFCCHAGRVAGC